jgi:MFS transporter, PPP family, 3-phenylpropionic acid transporter
MKINSINKLGITLLFLNAFVYISNCFYTPFLSSYYSKAGLRAVEIGILLTIGPVVAILIQPIWAVISDKTGRRKDVLSLVVIGSGLSMFSYYIGKSFFTFFLATLLLSVFSTSILPLSDAITLRNAHKYQLDFAKIRLGGTLGFAIVVILAGAIVRVNPELQFIMGFFGYMMLLLLTRKLPEDEIEEIGKKDRIGHFKIKQKTVHKPFRLSSPGLFHIFESKQIYFMLAFAFINQVGLSFNGSFVGVYLIKLGLTEGEVGIMNSICAISEIPVLFLINRILNKISTMKLTILSCLILGLRIFIVTGGNVQSIVAAQALNGLTYMIMYFSCAVFISKNVKQENQSKGQSILAIIQTGIGSIVGNIVGGYFVDCFGLNSAYRYMAFLILAVSGVILLIQVIYHKSVKKNKLSCTN